MREMRLRSRALRADRIVIGGTAIDPLTLKTIRDYSLFFATLSNVPAPSYGRVWLTTRQDAQDLANGGVVDTNGATYMVVMHGDFAPSLMHPPPGAAPPNFPVLELMFDASTLKLTDWGLSPTDPVTSPLGAGTDFLAAAG